MAKVARKSHIFDRHKHDWYIEPKWCSERLFAVEPFTGRLHDPCCGSGRIVEAANAAGLKATGSDCRKVKLPYQSKVEFYSIDRYYDNIVSNPPFNQLQYFCEWAVNRARKKTAVLFPLRRLPAATWLLELPLHRIYLLTPRPSMPTADVVFKLAKEGKEPSGGTQDFCWVVFSKGTRPGTPPDMTWLHRDGDLTW